MPYSFHQTLPPLVEGAEPRKVSALLLAEREWDKLRYDLRWKEHQAAAVAAATAWKRSIKRKSDDLKKNWKDTVKNIRQAQLDARNARLEAYTNERNERFAQIQRDKAEEKRLFLEACDRLLFYTKDSVNTLNGAMVFSETLRERAIQVEFEKKLRDIEVQREAEYAARVKQDVKDYEREEREKKEAHDKRMKEYQAEILKSLHDQEEHNRITKERTQRHERQDVENLVKEMELGKRLEREARDAFRQDTRNVALESLEFVRAAKERAQMEEEEEDRVIAVEAEAKTRIAMMRKQHVKEEQDAALALRAKLTEKLMAEMKTKGDNAEEILRKAIAEREAAEELERQKKEAYRQRMIRELKQNHHDYLEAEKLRKEEERQAKKWDMLQRFRTEEVNEAHARRKALKHETDIVEYRAVLAKQIADQDYIRQVRYDGDLYAMEQAHWKKEDDAFFKYAEEVVSEAKAAGRPLYPIERAIHAYRDKNSLLPHAGKTLPHNKSTLPFGRAKDKSHMPVKTKKKQQEAQTIPDGQCTCGPILCSCPAAAAAPTVTVSDPSGPCTCGPIICSCPQPATTAAPDVH